jgi:carbamate kinase
MALVARPSEADDATVSLTVLALGGNALLRRGEPLDPAVQDANVARAASAIGTAVADDEGIVITHGNGPQVGLLALADAARQYALPFPLDVLDAESEGMIGYLLARHLHGALGGRPVAPLLTQVVVDLEDPAFEAPSKPIGPVYRQDEATAFSLRFGWTVALDGGPDSWRRVVASPAPLHIVELAPIRALLDSGAVVVCAGGGGVPVAEAAGRLVGVEAVVDKDATSALLAQQLGADRLVLLTDVEAVLEGWGTPDARPIRSATPDELEQMDLAAGSMAPKVRAACSFARATGRPACIGSLDRLVDVLAGRSGTVVSRTTTADVSI